MLRLFWKGIQLLFIGPQCMIATQLCTLLLLMILSMLWDQYVYPDLLNCHKQDYIILNVAAFNEIEA
ncbi:Hypothetical predicted protein [Olea europaea subsp. europaea]|uniref:Uncharacterized protein n=1 Tax=Olea europaea subsp. europaea TaxID=158383 RepID=A0A8S0UXW6_OLEEU|nr:Hypothetical predicted protein [Olea europaea subsp. europaea]